MKYGGVAHEVARRKVVAAVNDRVPPLAEDGVRVRRREALLEGHHPHVRVERGDRCGRARDLGLANPRRGVRDLALEQFGPMAATLMGEWGVRQCGDIGDMVFHLIEEQIFGKQESDRPEDFSGNFDLEESLRIPFIPLSRRSPVTIPTPAPSTPANPRTTQNLKNS